MPALNRQQYSILIVTTVALVVVVVFFVKALARANAPLVDPNDPRIAAGQLPRVTMYSAEWCGICRGARAYFSTKQVPINEYDIEKDQAAMREYQRTGARGVPVIVVDGSFIQGFDRGAFESLYLSKLENYSVESTPTVLEN